MDGIFLTGINEDEVDYKKKWLILSKSLFTINGLDCNKIGISYPGFRNQPGDHCSEFPNTCLHSQIKDYALVQYLNLYHINLLIHLLYISLIYNKHYIVAYFDRILFQSLSFKHVLHVFKGFNRMFKFFGFEIYKELKNKDPNPNQI